MINCKLILKILGLYNCDMNISSCSFVIFLFSEEVCCQHRMCNYVHSVLPAALKPPCQVWSTVFKFMFL